MDQAGAVGRWKLKTLWQRFALLVGAGVIALGIGTAYLLRDPLPRFAERRSSLGEVTTSGSTIENGYVYTPAHLVAKSGLAVDLVVRRAVQDTGARRTLPLAVILGGH